MKLEAGKKYTDRRGRVYGPLFRVDGSCGGLFGENREDYAWYGDGQRSPGRELPSDLVAEYVEPVQPEQEYRLLKDGEPFQDGDEYLDIDDKWCKAPASENRTFNPQIYFPHRRLVEPAPVESPDDWVILDPVVYADHVPRVGIDQFQPSNGVWVTQERGHAKDTIGQYYRSCGGISRCRRKDLPAVPPKTRTVVLKEWLCWDDSHPEHVCLEWCVCSPASDDHQFESYYHAVETGNTRTVEIPVT